MTPKQIELARHALGLPNKMRTSYRNRFVAGEDHEDYREWCEMVSNGDACVRSGRSLLFSGDSLFWLTRKGAEKALRPKEKLDAEDF